MRTSAVSGMLAGISLLLLLLLPLAARSSAGRRVTLVVGDGSRGNKPVPASPPNDAADVVAAQRQARSVPLASCCVDAIVLRVAPMRLLPHDATSCRPWTRPPPITSLPPCRLHSPSAPNLAAGLGDTNSGRLGSSAWLPARLPRHSCHPTSCQRCTGQAGHSVPGRAQSENRIHDCSFMHGSAAPVIRHRSVHGICGGNVAAFGTDTDGISPDLLRRPGSMAATGPCRAGNVSRLHPGASRTWEWPGESPCPCGSDGVARIPDAPLCCVHVIHPDRFGEARSLKAANWGESA